MIIKAMNQMRRTQPPAPAPAPPPPTTEERLLAEIRDLLKAGTLKTAVVRLMFSEDSHVER